MQSILKDETVQDAIETGAEKRRREGAIQKTNRGRGKCIKALHPKAQELGELELETPYEQAVADYVNHN